jgi:hypothetical protein
MKKKWICLLAFPLLLAACTSILPDPAEPTQTLTGGLASTVPAAPQFATPTQSGPRPTRTLTPSPIPIPTATRSLTPTKPLPTPPEGRVILIEYFDKYGGEPPLQPPDVYVGRYLPRLVVYTDGQLIWRDDAGALWEGVMEESVVCTLLGGLQKFGLFKVEGDGSLGADDPIYSKIPDSDRENTGAVNFLLLVNGDPSTWMLIYRPFVDYLVQPVKSSWEVFNSYVPDDLDPYQAQLYALWIEESQKLARSYGAGQDLDPAIWPDELEKLNKLLGDAESVQILMDEEQADLLLQYYDPAPGVKIFKEGKEEKDVYSVMLRPLLPHEDPGDLSPVPQGSQRFQLPFKCPK